MSILGLGNPTETVKMFDDDEFSTTEVIDSIGRRQQTYIISEAGHLAMAEARSHGRNKDGSIFAFAPTVKITRKGLALLHTRLGETLLNKTLETITH